MAYSSLGNMFFDICSKHPDKTGYLFKSRGEYHPVTFKEMKERVTSFAAGLSTMNIGKGDTVLLLAENRLEWAIVDYAVLALGAITVPIYPTLLPRHISFIVNNSEAKVMIVSDQQQLQKIMEIRGELPKLSDIVLMDGDVPDQVHSWNSIVQKGKEALSQLPDLVQKTVQAVTREDTASLIYTSGTTGLPKGVILTHGNFLSNVEGALSAIRVLPDDLFLSFLPLSHVFERMVGHFLATFCGATIAYAESLDTVAQNMQEVRPTLMAGVPRFYEKVYARVLNSLEESSAVRRKIFYWALDVGKQADKYRQKGKPLKGGLKLRYKIADKLVYSKLKERVGGRIRLFVSGGAPLSREVAEFFNAAGLHLLEGYGLTESSPVITCNREDHFKFGSTGLKLDNVEVAIAEDGEILTRGPHVMKGYFKNDEETREAIDGEGWLHTGDIGYLDDEGFLFITDRKKNLLVTSGGKNIAPQPIENLLNQSRYIEQSVVVGDRHKYCSALIVPDMEKLKAYARSENLRFGDDSELLELPEIKQLIRKEIDAVSVDLASYETIKKFVLLKEAFTIENGQLTPTLKVKRNILEEKYRDKIEAMYAGEE